MKIFLIILIYGWHECQGKPIVEAIYYLSTVGHTGLCVIFSWSNGTMKILWLTVDFSSGAAIHWNQYRKLKWHMRKRNKNKWSFEKKCRISWAFNQSSSTEDLTLSGFAAKKKLIDNVIARSVRYTIKKSKKYTRLLNQRNHCCAS